jgi:hypothetical protein
MKRRPIHRGGILSAGYDARARHLDVEFDTHRLVRVENIGPEAADRFLNSGSPGSYWRDVIEDGLHHPRDLQSGGRRSRRREKGHG